MAQGNIAIFACLNLFAEKFVFGQIFVGQVVLYLSADFIEALHLILVKNKKLQFYFK